MLTLPTEILNNKDLQVSKPILLVEFADIPYHIASQYYELEIATNSDGSISLGSAVFTSATATFISWNAKPGDKVNIVGDDIFIIASVDSETQVTFTTVTATGGTGLTYTYFQLYYDLLKKKNSLQYQVGINETIKGISTIGNFKLMLLDWKNTLLPNIIGSNPDLTQSRINIYLKYDTSNYLKSNTINFVSGKVKSYSISKDVMTINIISYFPDFPDKFPSNSILDKYPESKHDIKDTQQLQYGDFDWLQTPIFWKGSGYQLAECLYVGRDSSNNYIFYVANHLMHNVPNASQILDSSMNNPFLMIRVFDEFARIAGTLGAFTNTATGCFFTMSAFEYDLTGVFYPNTKRIFAHPTEIHSGNTEPAAANAIDGDSSTICTISSGTILQVKTFIGSNERSINIDYNIQAHILISVGATSFIDPADKIVFEWINPSGGWYMQGFITQADTGSVVEVTFNGTQDFATGLNLGSIKLYADPGNIDAYTCEIKGITVAFDYEGFTTYNDASWQTYFDNNPFIYLKCQGREYSGTWDSRKTAGNLIENPADVLESIFRDEFLISNFSNSSFDSVNAIMANIKTKVSIWKQITRKSFVDDFIKAFNFAFIYDAVSDIWNLIIPVESGYNFSNSGTATPGNQDIFTDVDSIDSSGKFLQNPINKHSLKLGRSNGDFIFKKLTIYAGYLQGNYFKTINYGAGNSYSIRNKYILSKTSMDALSVLLLNWISKQKCIISFSTYHNAIGYVIGDIVNVQHDQLSDSMVDKTVVTQKYMILSIRNNWHPAQISLKLIEIL